ncbi:MAG: hypothetical protein IKW98_05720 [Prevotella sp.]|nr:hypothetical protein [Prevotella sp.]
MKKNLFKSIAFLAVGALSGMVFNSCKGGSGSGIVEDAIKQAEQTIATEEAPVFGNLPSLFEQKLEAGTIVGKFFRELKTEDMDAAVKNKSLRDEAEKQLAEYYKAKIAEATTALEGKDIKVEFDKNQISDANVKLKVEDAERGNFFLVFDVTMAKPVNKEVEFKWLFMDAEGNELEQYSDYITPGEKISMERMVSPDKHFGKKFEHLYLKF